MEKLKAFEKSFLLFIQRIENEEIIFKQGLPIIPTETTEAHEVCRGSEAEGYLLERLSKRKRYLSTSSHLEDSVGLRSR